MNNEPNGCKLPVDISRQQIEKRCVGISIKFGGNIVNGANRGPKAHLPRADSAEYTYRGAVIVLFPLVYIIFLVHV